MGGSDDGNTHASIDISTDLGIRFLPFFCKQGGKFEDHDSLKVAEQLWFLVIALAPIYYHTLPSLLSYASELLGILSYIGVLD
jgi:hypothetical protein